jgi:hypothetical protein
MKPKSRRYKAEEAMRMGDPDLEGRARGIEGVVDRKEGDLLDV